MGETVRIKDKRKGRFMVDDVVLNGYGKSLGATGIAFYVTLCRYTNNQSQQCYPSLNTLSAETGMKPHTIIKAAKKCIGLGLIKKEVFPGKYTLYTLLEPPMPKGALLPKGQSTTPERAYKRTKIERTKNIKYQDKPDGESFLKSKELRHIFGLKGGAKFPWQEHAARIAKSLGFKPGKNWFKLFRDAYLAKRQPLLDKTYTQVADADMRDAEKYFYKVFYANLKGNS